MNRPENLASQRVRIYTWGRRAAGMLAKLSVWLDLRASILFWPDILHTGRESDSQRYLPPFIFQLHGCMWFRSLLRLGLGIYWGPTSEPRSGERGLALSRWSLAPVTLSSGSWAMTRVFSKKGNCWIRPTALECVTYSPFPSFLVCSLKIGKEPDRTGVQRRTA